MYKSGSDLAKMGSYKKRYFILDVDLDAKDRKEYVSVLKYYMDRGVAGKGYKQKGTIYLTGDGCRFGIIAWPRTTRLFSADTDGDLENDNDDSLRHGGRRREKGCGLSSSGYTST